MANPRAMLPNFFRPLARKTSRMKAGKPLPPAPKQKLKNRVLRARARQLAIIAGKYGQGPKD
jgi:hypothetical protein